MKLIAIPKTEIIQFNNFDLSKLKQTFVIPNFERQLRGIHVRKIVEAIKDNRFYDNIIRVIRRNNGAFEVLDGQHRLAALWCVHKELHIKTYDLIIQIFDSNFTRIVFRRLNMGKPLLLQDHTRAFDDGTNPFFNKLRHLLAHENRSNKTTFTNMLHGLKYSKTGSLITVKPHRLEKFIQTINKEDIEFCKIFLGALYYLSPTVPHTVHFKSAVFRNACRLSYENNLQHNDIIKLVSAMIKNPKLIDYVESYTLKDISILYELTLKEFANILGRSPKIDNKDFDRQLIQGVL